MGVDFHTNANESWMGSSKSSPEKQLSIMNEIYNKNYIPFENRIFKIAVTFPLGKTAKDLSNIKRSEGLDYNMITREDCSNFINKTRNKNLWKMSKVNNRNDAWKAMTQSMFTLSPLGNGYDCHRSWEAWILGSIVIIPKSPIAQQYERMNLPVVIISNLDEITKENLLKWKFEQYPKIKNSYKNLTEKYQLYQFNKYK